MMRKILIWIWEQEGTPAQRARGIAVGVFSGCFPFFGFQTLMGIVLASLVKGNHLLAVAGTWISNPFTYLPLYWFNYKIGNWLTGGGQNLEHLNSFTKEELLSKGWSFGYQILVGSTFVGLLFGCTFGVIIYLFLDNNSSKTVSFK